MQEKYEYNFNILNTFSEKVESRIKELHYNRQSIIGINSIEDFVFSKMKLTQFFFDIEDDFRELLHKYKNLYINNKELHEKNQLQSISLKNLELKILNSEKIQEEYKQNIKEFVNQISFLKEKKYKNEDHIKFLEVKLKTLDRYSNRKNNNVLDDYNYRESSRERYLTGRDTRLERNYNNTSYCSEIFSNFNENGNFNRRKSNLIEDEKEAILKRYEIDSSKDISNNRINKNQTNQNINLNNDGKINNSKLNKYDNNLVEGFLKNYKNNNSLNESKTGNSSPLKADEILSQINFNNNIYPSIAEENKPEMINSHKIDFEVADENQRNPKSKTLEFDEKDQVR